MNNEIFEKVEEVIKNYLDNVKDRELSKNEKTLQSEYLNLIKEIRADENKFLPNISRLTNIMVLVSMENKPETIDGLLNASESLMDLTIWTGGFTEALTKMEKQNIIKYNKEKNEFEPVKSKIKENILQDNIEIGEKTGEAIKQYLITKIGHFSDKDKVLNDKFITVIENIKKQQQERKV